MGELDLQQIKIHKKVDLNAFKKIVDDAEPVILKDCDFGECMTKWNLAYLNEKIADRDSNEATKPPKIEDDFPALSDDLKLPSFIPLGKDDLYHSSSLHITANNTQIRTHYDIYDNILCQVAGLQRVILFEPSDTPYIYMDEPHLGEGELNEFGPCCTSYRPALRDAEPSFCYLEPGDCLFIPKFWWQNIRAVKSQSLDPDFGSGGDTNESATDPFPCYSIAFNIFFRDQQLVAESQYPDDDVHNDKQLKPYEQALEHAILTLGHLDRLPEKSKYLYKFLIFRLMKKKLDVSEIEPYLEYDPCD